MVSKISANKYGEVVIKFNSQMNTSFNLSFINQTNTNIFIKP